MNTCDSIMNMASNCCVCAGAYPVLTLVGGMFMDDGQKNTKSGSKALYMAL
jgi:hypothetical protein